MKFHTKILLVLSFVFTTPNLFAQELTREPKTIEVTDEHNRQGHPIPNNPFEPDTPNNDNKLKANYEADATNQLRLEVGQTRLVHASKRIIRVSVAEPSVADIQVVTNKQVLITAKAVGYTHLILWSVDNRPLVIAVSVTRNLDQLRQQFEELFQDEEIHISAIGDLIVLSGTVTDLRVPARAAEVAQLHTDRLANLIQVSGDQQVQLDVRFAEVSRTGMRKAGVNMLWSDTQRGYVAGQSTSDGMPGQYLREDFSVPGTGSGGPPLVPIAPHGDAFNLFFSTGLSNFPFSAILSILVQEGLAKVLAEPTLTALSGQAAEFHAGGEVPILIAQELGKVSTEYKKFGVHLTFTPTVLGKDSMNLKLSVEVSEPDPTAGVVVTGFRVPGFKTRRSETTIRLGDGQSFAIAGLLSDSSRNTVSKVPILGDIPILGMLFRSTAYQREETELLMVVTGHLVRPITSGEVPLIPGEDEFNDPNDFELFLMGQVKMENIKEEEEKYKSEDKKTTTDTSAQATEPDPMADPNSPSIEKAASNEGPIGPIGFMRN